MDEQEGVLACLGGKADGPSNGKEGYWRFSMSSLVWHDQPNAWMPFVWYDGRLIKQGDQQARTEKGSPLQMYEGCSSVCRKARIFGTIRDDDLDGVQGFCRSLGLFDQMTGNFFGVKSKGIR